MYYKVVHRGAHYTTYLCSAHRSVAKKVKTLQFFQKKVKVAFFEGFLLRKNI